MEKVQGIIDFVLGIDDVDSVNDDIIRAFLGDKKLKKQVTIFMRPKRFSSGSTFIRKVLGRIFEGQRCLICKKKKRKRNS